MNRQDLINKLMLSSDKQIFKSLNEIYKYENIKFEFDMFFSSTPVYHVSFQNPYSGENEEWLEPMCLKHVIPDFLMDNFTTLRREETKIIVDFLHIFFVHIFILNLLFIVKKNQTLYLNPLKSYQYIIATINNRKNVEYFFKNFFKKKVRIIENIPSRYANNNQFKFGKSILSAKAKDNMSSIGEYVYTSLNKYHVFLDIEFEELRKLENCYFSITRRKLVILKSNPLPDFNKQRFYFCMAFIGTVLTGIYALLPNEVPND